MRGWCFAGMLHHLSMQLKQIIDSMELHMYGVAFDATKLGFGLLALQMSPP